MPVLVLMATAHRLIGLILKIVEATSLLVIANGEVWSVDDWRNCQEQTGCEDVMLGRV